ncbi:MAG: hypothetical protein V1779_07805 [bacterium]
MKNNWSIDKTGFRTNKMIYGLFHINNFKKSLILLLVFIIIDIPLTYLSSQNRKAGQPYIGEWESTFELLSIGIFLLTFILFTIVNYPGKMSLKLLTAYVFGIIFLIPLGGFLIMFFHLESIFEILVIGLFLLLVISSFVISGFPEERKQKYKLIIAIGVGSLWTFGSWVIIYFLNWQILYYLFD